MHSAEPAQRQGYAYTPNQDIRAEGEDEPGTGFPRFQATIGNPVLRGEVTTSHC